MASAGVLSPVLRGNADDCSDRAHHAPPDDARDARNSRPLHAAAAAAYADVPVSQFSIGHMRRAYFSSFRTRLAVMTTLMAIASFSAVRSLDSARSLSEQFPTSAVVITLRWITFIATSVDALSLVFANVATFQLPPLLRSQFFLLLIFSSFMELGATVLAAPRGIPSALSLTVAYLGFAFFGIGHAHSRPLILVLMFVPLLLGDASIIIDTVLGEDTSLFTVGSSVTFTYLSARRSAALTITTVILTVASTAFVKAEQHSAMLIMESPRESEVKFEWAHELPDQAMTRLRASLVVRRHQVREMLAREAERRRGVRRRRRCGCGLFGAWLRARMSNRWEPLSPGEQVAAEQAWRLAHALEGAQAAWWRSRESRGSRRGGKEVARRVTGGKNDASSGGGSYERGRWQGRTRAAAAFALAAALSFFATRVPWGEYVFVVILSAFTAASTFAASVLWMWGNMRWRTVRAVLRRPFTIVSCMWVLALFVADMANATTQMHDDRSVESLSERVVALLFLQLAVVTGLIGVFATPAYLRHHPLAEAVISACLFACVFVAAVPWFTTRDNHTAIARFNKAVLTVGSLRRSASIPTIALLGRAMLPNLRRALRTKWRTLGSGHKSLRFESRGASDQSTQNPLPFVSIEMTQPAAGGTNLAAAEKADALPRMRWPTSTAEEVADDIVFPQLAVARPRAGAVDLYVLDVARSVAARLREREGGMDALAEWLDAFDVDVDALAGAGGEAEGRDSGSAAVAVGRS